MCHLVANAGFEYGEQWGIEPGLQCMRAEGTEGDGDEGAEAAEGEEEPVHPGIVIGAATVSG